MTMSLLNTRHAPVRREGQFVITACRLKVQVAGDAARRYFAPGPADVTCPHCVEALAAEAGRVPP